jgi:hypothetical protein
VAKTGGILEGQEPYFVWGYGRNGFQFLVGSNSVSWLRWCAGRNTGGASAFCWPFPPMNTSARTGRKWNERPIQEVVVRVLVIVKMLGTERIHDRDPDTLARPKLGVGRATMDGTFVPFTWGEPLPKIEA